MLSPELILNAGVQASALSRWLRWYAAEIGGPVPSRLPDETDDAWKARVAYWWKRRSK